MMKSNARCERCEKHKSSICLECAGEDAAEIERLKELKDHQLFAEYARTEKAEADLAAIKREAREYMSASDIRNWADDYDDDYVEVLERHTKSRERLEKMIGEW